MWKALHEFLDSTIVGTAVSMIGLVVSGSAWIAVMRTKRRFVRELGARRIVDQLKKDQRVIRTATRQGQAALASAQTAAKRCMIDLRAMQKLMPQIAELKVAADAIENWTTPGLSFTTAAAVADELGVCVAAINNELEIWLRS